VSGGLAGCITCAGTSCGAAANYSGEFRTCEEAAAPVSFVRER